MVLTANTEVRCSNPYCRKLLLLHLDGVVKIVCPRCHTTVHLDTRKQKG